MTIGDIKMKGAVKIFIRGIFKKVVIFRVLVLSISAGGTLWGSFAFAQYNYTDPNSFDHTRYSPTMPEALNSLSALPFPLNTGVRQVAAERPSFVKDKEGNMRVYLGGELLMMIEPNGDQTFFGGGQKYCKVNRQRELLEDYGWDNAGMCAVRNSEGQITGYEQYRFGGKIVSRFDSNMNLTNMYFYDDNGEGYWDYNLITQEWSRVEMGKAVEKRNSTKEGDICSYWREDGEYLWEVRMTSIIVRDKEGRPVLGNDGKIVRKIVEGERIKYDKDNRSVPLEAYGFDGKLETTYISENNRLKIVINHKNGTYQEYGSRFDNQLLADGSVTSAGERIPEWIHEWKGTRHTAAYEYVFAPLTGELVKSGKEINYTVENNMDNIILTVNDLNISWVAPLYEDSGLGAPQVGDDILLEDYVYFYEVSDLDISELAEFFGIDSDFARLLNDVIVDYKSKNKADAGLFTKVTHGIGKKIFRLFNEENKQESVLRADGKEGVSLEAGILKNTAKSYLECGEYNWALEECEEFERRYLENIDSSEGLRNLYREVLDIKAQALAKVNLI
jgi:hypothetical protein